MGESRFISCERYGAAPAATLLGVIAILLGLAASLSWGIADFFGGIQSRRMPVVAVVLGSQLSGLVLVVAVVAIRGEAPPGGDFAIYAALSSLAGIVGLTAFYRALSIGSMGVVAPLSSTAAVIPVVVGIATGDRPSALQAAGVALAVVGVVLASREAGEQAGESRAVSAGAGLALLSAAGFGLFFLGIDRASDADVVWAVFVNRAVSAALLGAALLAVRPQLSVRGGDLRILVMVGVLDTSANWLFAVASTMGLVSVVAVLSSLYPVTTVVLARFVLGERLRRSQRFGAAAALAGVALISAG
jgi:drug/metabolite transporter (DMT)-like permease